MFNDLLAWQYRDDNNCWDFVRACLLRIGVPVSDIPKYGINPNDKIEMTRASIDVAQSFIECGPINYAVASEYRGKTILHVGIVYNGYIYHASKSKGAQKTKVKDFENTCHKIVYRIHKSLCQY